MIDFSNFYQLIAKSPLSHWLETLPAQVAAWQRDALHGKFREWERAVEFLPELTPWRLDLLHSVTAESETPLSEGHQRRIENLLKNLMPWRKGPYSLYGINIDTEWRSDWKWERVLPHLSDLTGRTILDVGCGSGYHMWRMIHRRSPLDHLWQLKDQLAPGGELVLETLVVEGDENTVLVPGDRYAQMRNVYFIPSAAALKMWLEKCGFIDVRIVDACVTSTEEQRRTEWMTTESLADFLDPQDQRKTVEGYPAPLRAVIIATKPETQQSLAKKAR